MEFCEKYLVPTILGKKTSEVLKVKVPGSKSITNRALLLAAMAEGESELRGVLRSEDASYFLECIKTLGFPVKEEGDGLTITGFGGKIPKKEASIYVGSAGTAARFLAAMLAFSDGTYEMQSSEQMKKRPMGPLIASLREAGAEVVCLEEEDHFPLRIKGCGDTLKNTELTVNIDKSSQFLSALLIAAGTRKEAIRIFLEGSHGMAYVEMTASMMKDFGVEAKKEDATKEGGNISYLISENTVYQNLSYDIEPDMSAAAYFYGIGAVTKSQVLVYGVQKKMLQGDVAFLDVLKKMGCDLQETEEGVLLLPAKQLAGNLTFDMSSFSDQALTLSAIAPFADGPITIQGISHIRLQECDRIHAIVTNLTALGISVQENQDVITICPGKMKGAEIETFDDHRVAMSFAIPGLLTEGVTILNPMCCKKTFAEYFDVLEEVTKKYL